MQLADTAITLLDLDRDVVKKEKKKKKLKNREEKVLMTLFKSTKPDSEFII